MEVVVKWIVAPLCLAGIWMLVIYARDQQRLDSLSPRGRLILRTAVTVGVILLVSIIWFVRKWSGG